MAIARKIPIKDLLTPQEKKTLERLYKSYRVTTDQLRRAPEVLSAIASAFERVESRRIEPGVLLRYMFNRRKLKDWPRLGKRAEKFPSMLNLLPADQLAALEKVYETIGMAVDAYQFKPSLARRLAEGFFTATRISEDGEVLVAVMIARRKRGLWPALCEEADLAGQSSSSESSFGDIAEVARVHKKKAEG
jgi:hypothetical protein